MEYHFSHSHPLTPYEALESEKIQCSGCELLASGSLYGCSECRYFLHQQCRNTGRWMDHPSHPKHALTLLPRPTYRNGSFACDGCRFSGKAFSLSCAVCEFDLHIQCAMLPLTMVHKDHPEHVLTLNFKFPVDESKNFRCDVCHCIVSRNCWVYYCEECDYGTHLGCAVEAPSQKQMETREPGQRVDDGLLNKDEEEKPLKQVVKQMMDTQLEIVRLQNELTHHMTELMIRVSR